MRILYPVTVEPVSTQPEAVSVDRWHYELPQPDRTPRRAAPGGGLLTEPLVPVVPDGFQGTTWQPDRSAVPVRGNGGPAAQVEPLVVVSPDAWRGTTWQPDRTPGRGGARPETFAPVYVETAPAAPPVDGWAFAPPQPDRSAVPVRGNGGTFLVEPLPVVYADAWHYEPPQPWRGAQPAPSLDPGRGQYTEVVAPLPPVDGWMFAPPQPWRLPRPAPGGLHGGLRPPLLIEPAVSAGLFLSTTSVYGDPVTVTAYGDGETFGGGIG